VSDLGAVHIWWSFLPFFAFINMCYVPIEGAAKWWIVWGMTVPWEMVLLYSWLGVPICDLAVKFCIPQFQALAWLHVDYIQSIF
jgi:hypothetical protein